MYSGFSFTNNAKHNYTHLEWTHNLVYYTRLLWHLGSLVKKKHMSEVPRKILAAVISLAN